MLRTWVYWPYVAATQPTDATDSDDPAYNFKDIDEFVRQAQIHGQEVLLTIWGTPNWANGGKGPNHMPTNVGAFRQFCYAVAHRYDGHDPAFPFVRFYSIWNEPNLAQFLAPQFTGKQDDGAEALRAALPRGLCGGEGGEPDGARRRRRDLAARARQAHDLRPGLALAGPVRRARRTAAPGDQVRRVGAPSVRPARRRRRLRRRAIQRHALEPGLFETKLRAAFHRRAVPIWITEYAHETKPTSRRASRTPSRPRTRSSP